MRTDFYNTAMNMLSLQLREEEENYRRAFAMNKYLWELKQIKQRIKALQQSLFSLTKWMENLGRS